MQKNESCGKKKLKEAALNNKSNFLHTHNFFFFYLGTKVFHGFLISFSIFRTCTFSYVIRTAFGGLLVRVQQRIFFGWWIKVGLIFVCGWFRAQNRMLSQFIDDTAMSSFLTEFMMVVHSGGAKNFWGRVPKNFFFKFVLKL